MLARKLLDLVLALGGLYRLGAAAALAGERLDRDEDLCKDGDWLLPGKLEYAPALLEAVTSIRAVDGLSPANATTVNMLWKHDAPVTSICASDDLPHAEI